MCWDRSSWCCCGFGGHHPMLARHKQHVFRRRECPRRSTFWIALADFAVVPLDRFDGSRRAHRARYHFVASVRTPKYPIPRRFATVEALACHYHRALQVSTSRTAHRETSILTTAVSSLWQSAFALSSCNQRQRLISVLKSSAPSNASKARFSPLS